MSLATILPDNATALEIALERILVSRLNGIASPFPSLWRPGEIDLGALPWLAEAVGVSEWDALASESEKRESVAAQWPNARQGGLGVAIRRAIEPLGLGVSVVPWYENGGAPYSFSVEVIIRDQAISLDTLRRVEDRLREVKSERDVYSINVTAEDFGEGDARGVYGPGVYVSAVFSDMVTIESAPFPSVYDSISD